MGVTQRLRNDINLLERNGGSTVGTTSLYVVSAALILIGFTAAFVALFASVAFAIGLFTDVANPNTWYALLAAVIAGYVGYRVGLTD